MGHFDPARPGSLLYVKNSSGDYVLVGAMYSAPADYTYDQLDAIIPLSVAHWHAHTNICLPNGVTLNDILRGDVHGTQIDMPGMLPVSSSPSAPAINQRLGFLADGRFGFTGKSPTPRLRSRRRPPAQAGVRLDGPRLSVQRRRPESSLRHHRPKAARELRLRVS